MSLNKGPHFEPLPRSECEELEQSLCVLEKLTGFVPATQLTMARMPRSTAVLIDAMDAFYSTATLSRELLNLIGMISYSTAGSQYGVAQNAATAKLLDLGVEKAAALRDYEESELFDEAERAALSFARKASQNPNLIRKLDVEHLLEHFNEDQVVEITSVIGLCGLFARFNDSIAVAMGPETLAIAKASMPNDE